MNRCWQPILATGEDASALSALDKSFNQDGWSLKQYQDSLVAGHQVWQLKNNIAVMVWVQVASDAELLRFFVAPMHQRQGIGYSLMQQWLEAARHLGATSLYLEVRATNHPAIRLYQKSGFMVYGIRKNYYSTPTNQCEDAWLMKKAL